MSGVIGMFTLETSHRRKSQKLLQRVVFSYGSVKAHSLALLQPTLCISYIDVSFLMQVEMMRELGYTWEQISSALMVSRTTLWRRLRDLGIQATAYTSISDSELDSVMSGLVGRFPQNGVVMMWGHLRSLNICITRARVYDSLMRVSSDLVQVRHHTAIRRRVYSVPAPNCLWHIDGLHCLIRWRIVVHGAIDGFSRRIVYLRASDNNRADTVMNLFRLAVHDCGWPSRVRSDKGGENIEVARAMLAVRGTGRRSHLAGSSVHNQRIERLWRDTFRCVCHFFYSMFYEMEDLGILDPVNDADLFSLHYVFIPRINVQLSQFMNAWNHHPLRTEHGFSPLRLWHQGMLAADPRWQQDIIDGFNIPSDYGVESSMHFTNTFEQQRVEIPRIDLQLSTEQVLELQTSFSPFQASDYGGADIYVDVRQHIFNNLHL